jgi:alpha-galactosidase
MYSDGPLEVWARPLDGGAMAVALFNLTTGATQMTLRLKDVGWQGPATARDLWTQENKGVLNGETTVVVPGHAVLILRLSLVVK